MGGEVRSRVAGRCVAAAFAICGVLTGPTSLARAATGAESGWWSSAPPAAAVDAAEGLLVQGGPNAASPIAYAAVTFALEVGESAATLTLAVAGDSASTPNTTLAACPLTEPFTPTQGGAMGDAPGFDCATKATAAPSDDGAAYRFDVAELAADGKLAVAILPTAATDRVVLDPPTVDSLATTRSAGDTSTSTASSSEELATDEPALEPATALGSDAFELPRPALSELPTAQPVAAPAPTPAATADPAPRTGAAPAPPVAAAPAGATSSSRSKLPAVAFVVLVALAATLWLSAGRQGEEEVVAA